jgi:hypothetical protein
MTEELLNLDQENINVKEWMQAAASDSSILELLLHALTEKHNTERHNSFIVLQQLSLTQPEVLIPKWSFFVQLLDSDSVYDKYVAVNMIINLSMVNKTGRLERIFHRLFALLQGPEFIPAAQLTMNAGIIARSHPSLQVKITQLLLNIDNLYTGDHIDILKGHIIQAFDDYFEVSEAQFQMMAFVREQLDSPEPTTQKIAREFMQKHKDTWD